MIIIEKEEFLKAIKAVKPSTEKGKLQPVLNTINIKSINGGLILTATDCTNIAKGIIEANIQEEEEINICINADKLENIVSSLDKTIMITIDKENAKCIIKSGKTKFECLYINGTEFPDTEINLHQEDLQTVVMNRGNYLNALNKVQYATQSENNNSVISGICLTLKGKDGYELVATDGNRLAKVVINEETRVTDKQIVIPKKILSDVAKIIKDEIKISFNDKMIIFEVNNFIFSTLLINGKYPQYNQLFPTNQPIVVKVDKNTLLSAIDKVAIMVNDRTNIITLNFDSEKKELNLECHCEDGEANDDIELIDYIGETNKIAFNYKYLLEGLRAITTKEISFEMNGNATACLIKSDFDLLVMPIQVK